MSAATDEHVSQPPLLKSESGTPNGSGSNNGVGNGYFSIPFERFVKDELSDFASGFTLLGSSRLARISKHVLTRHRHHGDIF